MQLELYKLYDDRGVSTILIALSIMLISGYLLSKLTKLMKLPNVTAYIICGLIIGPYVLDLIPHNIIDNMGFLSDLALGFIAFGVGRFFKKEVLKETGLRVIIVTILEALLAGVLVTIAIYFLFPNMGINFALLLGAIATATAPASTMMTINQYKAKGEFVNTLLQVVALDDVVCLLVFSIVCAIVTGNSSGNVDFVSVILPILYNILFIIIGLAAGFILPIIIKGRSHNSKLIITIGLISIIAGVASLFDVSPLLSCMCFGASYVNKCNDEKIFKYVDDFDGPIMLLFFVMSGMNMNLSAFKTIGLVGIVYFIVRIVGKYLGSYIGCKMTKYSKETTKYLGFALIPQAGVAIGLAFLGERMLPEEIGNTFLSVILCSSVLYEMTGPIIAKYALFKSGSISEEIRKENTLQKTLQEKEEEEVIVIKEKRQAN